MQLMNFCVVLLTTFIFVNGFDERRLNCPNSICHPSEPLMCMTGDPHINPNDMPINLTVAIYADVGSNPQSQAAMQMLGSHKPHLVIHAGDLSYDSGPNQPETWLGLVKQYFGTAKYLAAVGNHDVGESLPGWNLSTSYKAIGSLAQELGTCEGESGVEMVCTFMGITVVIVAPGVKQLETASTAGQEYDVFIADSFRKYPSKWRICVWHKNQRLMQVGTKGDETGWHVYEECRRQGALVVTGHEHVYSRSFEMDSFIDQRVSSYTPSSFATPSVLRPEQTLFVNDDTQSTVAKGTSVVLVVGTGGYGIRPFGTDVNNTWWAAAQSRENGLVAGGMICTFNVNGQQDKAYCEFLSAYSDTPFDKFWLQTAVAVQSQASVSGLVNADTPSFIRIQVNSTGDDVLEASGLLFCDSPSIHLGVALFPTGLIPGISAFRFQDIPLSAQDADLVVGAYISFYIWSSDRNAVPCSLTINSEAAPDSDPLCGRLSMRSRNWSDITVNWTDVQPWDGLDENYRSGMQAESPNLKALVKNTLTQPGWKAGNAMTFFVQGFGTRSIRSFDMDGGCHAPTLVIEVVNKCTDGTEKDCYFANGFGSQKCMNGHLLSCQASTCHPGYKLDVNGGCVPSSLIGNLVMKGQGCVIPLQGGRVGLAPLGSATCDMPQAVFNFDQQGPIINTVTKWGLGVLDRTSSNPFIFMVQNSPLTWQLTPFGNLKDTVSGGCLSFIAEAGTGNQFAVLSNPCGTQLFEFQPNPTAQAATLAFQFGQSQPNTPKPTAASPSFPSFASQSTPSQPPTNLNAPNFASINQPTSNTNPQPTSNTNLQPTSKTNLQSAPPSYNFQPSPSYNFQPTPTYNFQSSPPSYNFQSSPPSYNFQPSPPSYNFQPTPTYNFQPTPRTNVAQPTAARATIPLYPAAQPSSPPSFAAQPSSPPSFAAQPSSPPSFAAQPSQPNFASQPTQRAQPVQPTPGFYAQPVQPTPAVGLYAQAGQPTQAVGYYSQIVQPTPATYGQPAQPTPGYYNQPVQSTQAGFYTQPVQPTPGFYTQPVQPTPGFSVSQPIQPTPFDYRTQPSQVIRGGGMAAPPTTAPIFVTQRAPPPTPFVVVRPGGATVRMAEPVVYDPRYPRRTRKLSTSLRRPSRFPLLANDPLAEPNSAHNSSLPSAIFDANGDPIILPQASLGALCAAGDFSTEFAVHFWPLTESEFAAQADEYRAELAGIAGVDPKQVVFTSVQTNPAKGSRLLKEVAFRRTLALEENITFGSSSASLTISQDGSVEEGGQTLEVRIAFKDLDQLTSIQNVMLMKNTMALGMFAASMQALWPDVACEFAPHNTPRIVDASLIPSSTASLNAKSAIMKQTNNGSGSALNGKLHYSWKVEQGFLEMTINAPTDGWIGFGIAASREGLMVGADAILGWFEGDHLHVGDYTLGSTREVGCPNGICLDSQQPRPDSELFRWKNMYAKDNLASYSGQHTPGNTTFTFKRLLNTQDPFDIAIGPGKATVLFAYGSNSILESHGANAGSAVIEFLPAEPALSTLYENHQKLGAAPNAPTLYWTLAGDFLDVAFEAQTTGYAAVGFSSSSSNGHMAQNYGVVGWQNYDESHLSGIALNGKTEAEVNRGLSSDLELFNRRITFANALLTAKWTQRVHKQSGTNNTSSIPLDGVNLIWATGTVDQEKIILLQHSAVNRGSSWIKFNTANVVAPLAQTGSNFKTVLLIFISWLLAGLVVVYLYRRTKSHEKNVVEDSEDVAAKPVSSPSPSAHCKTDNENLTHSDVEQLLTNKA